MVRGLCVITMNCVFFSERAQGVDEAPDVGLVQRCVYLVQNADRRWVRLQQRQQKRQRRQRPLAAGEHRERVDALAGRLRHDIDAGVGEVVRLRQAEVRLAAVEERLRSSAWNSLSTTAKVVLSRSRMLVSSSSIAA